jgi:glycerol-3-phosphate acyltransferase PlsX
MGGDHAPEAPVAGAVAAARDGVRVVLVGRSQEIRPLLDAQHPKTHIPVVHAEDALAMDSGALASWRRPRSSVAVACHLIRHGDASALVSAGSTGGVVATARLRLRALHGVPRPALAVVLPTLPTPTVLLDAGATADPKPEMLVQFAHLGTAYAEVALGIPRPSVGLLNIGEEDSKGDKLTRRAYDLLAAAHGLSFDGNVEGDDLLTGRVSVVVTDGFTGNVALKTVEGAVRYTAHEMFDAMTSTRLARTGAWLQRKHLRGVRNRLDSETYGGAALLGLAGTVVIAHGASTASGITAACHLASDLTHGHITDRIREHTPPPDRRFPLRRP